MPSGGDLLLSGLSWLADGLTNHDDEQRVRPLDGAQQDWRYWLSSVAPDIRIDLMSPRHIELWRWIESLRPGVRPPAFFADWPRAYGKTTTGRLSMARVCARAVRGFGLYVCGTLPSANASVVSIRSEFERQGVSRRESQYGHSLGWSSERLVTENGFTLVALGLDVANIRGLNLDKLRPDLICHERDTLILTEGEMMRVQDHPTAQECVGRGFKVAVHGVPFEETVTCEHRYWAKTIVSKKPNTGRRYRSDGAENWVHARDLTTDHYLCYPVDESVQEPQGIPCYVPGMNKCRRDDKGRITDGGGQYVNRVPEEFSDAEWWWFFGLWWGDGHVAGKYQVGITIANTQEHLTERVSALLCRYAIKFSRVEKPGCHQLIFSHAAFNRWLRTWKAVGGKPGQKQPPIWVERIAPLYQEALIKGYVAADGYQDPKDTSIRVTSVSLQGLLSLRRILMRFGIAATIRKGIKAGRSIINGIDCNVQPKYDLRFCKNGERLGYACTQTDRFSFQSVFVEDGKLWSKIKDISEVAEAVFVPINTKSRDYLTAFGRSHNCLDDIDGLTDSPEVSDKKLEIISSTIIPAGSRDCAVLVTQNEIHGHSVVHRIINGDAGILRRRIVSKAVAVEGLEIESVPATDYRAQEPGIVAGYNPDAWSWEDAPGDWHELDGVEIEDGVEKTVTGKLDDELRIVGGKSTWPAKSLKDWEEELNAMGELAFRREMQHELGAGGLFFNFHAQKQHVDRETGELSSLLDWHLCDPPRIGPHWQIDAGGDYGTRAAHCQHVVTLDEYGVLYYLGEEYAEDRTAKQQAQALLLLLESLGFAGQPVDGVIATRDKSVAGGIRSLDVDQHERPVKTRLASFALDPAGTFAPQGKGSATAQERMTEYPEEVFYRYAIPLVRANKGKVAGLNRLREAMHGTVTYPANHPTEPGRTVPKLRIVRGACPNLQRGLETAIKDPKNELVCTAAAKLLHALDSGEYACTRALESTDPTAPKAILLKDGSTVEPDAAQWYRDAMQPFAVEPSNGVAHVKRYRGVAGRGRA